MESMKDEENSLENDAFTNRKPVQCMKDGRDVSCAFSECYKSGRRVLQSLETSELVVGKVCEDRIAKVQTRRYQRVHEGFGCLSG